MRSSAPHTAGLLRSTRSNAALALGVIVAAGVVLRLYRLDAPLADQHAFRQTQTASQVWLYDRFGFDLFDYHVPMFGGGFWVLEFPFYQWIVYAVSSVVGHLEIVGRLVSIASFVVSALLLYGIARRLTGRTLAALGAVFFVAFLPITVFYGRAFMIDPMLIACVLLALYALLRLVEAFEWTWFAVLSGALLVAGLGKPNLVVVFGLPMVLLGLRVLLDRRNGWPERAALVLLPIVTGVLVRLWMNHADRVNEASNGMTFANMRWWYLGTTFTNGGLWRTIGQRMSDQLTIVGIIVVVLGCFAVWDVRTRYRPELVAMVVSIPLTIGIFANLNGVHDYYQLPYYFIIAIIGGLGLAALASLVNDRAGGLRVVGVAAAVLAVTWSLNLFSTYFGSEALNLGWQQEGAKLRSITPDDRLLLVQDGDPNEPNLWYEARRIGWRVPTGDPEAAGAIVRGEPEPGAIVTITGEAPAPDWVAELAQENGFDLTFDEAGYVVYRRPNP